MGEMADDMVCRECGAPYNEATHAIVTYKIAIPGADTGGELPPMVFCANCAREGIRITMDVKVDRDWDSLLKDAM